MGLSNTAAVKSNSPTPVIGIESKHALDNLDIEDKVSRIAISAYFKAEARGYEPGHEIQDWLEAEAEVEKIK